MAKSKRRFQKGAIIRFTKRLWKCICCDSEMAVLAPTVRKNDGGFKTKFKDMVAVSNVVDFDDLKFEIVK